MTYYAARAAGYVLALALVLGLVMVSCGALARLGDIGPGTYRAPTLEPWPTTGPEPRYQPVPHVTDDPHATPAPAPVYDCGDASADDPEIDPEYDCEEIAP
jgi:hypothetical protein